MKNPYNRNKENKITKDLLSNQFIKIKNYQIAYYYINENTGERHCIDEWLVKPEDKNIAMDYLQYDSYRVFVNYEDGLQEELTK